MDSIDAMQLYLLRHAHAGDPAKWTGDDADRPLSAKGRAQAERLGALLHGIGFRPDALVSSPKVRARETAETVAKALGGHPRTELRIDERLAYAFDLPRLRELVDELGAPERLLLVGHDPDLSELLGELIGVDYIQMRKGSLARIDFDAKPARDAGILRWLLPPELLAGED